MVGFGTAQVIGNAILGVAVREGSSLGYHRRPTTEEPHRSWSFGRFGHAFGVLFQQLHDPLTERCFWNCHVMNFGPHYRQYPPYVLAQQQESTRTEHPEETNPLQRFAARLSYLRYVGQYMFNTATLPFYAKGGSFYETIDVKPGDEQKTCMDWMLLMPVEQGITEHLIWHLHHRPPSYTLFASDHGGYNCVMDILHMAHIAGFPLYHALDMGEHHWTKFPGRKIVHPRMISAAFSNVIEEQPPQQIPFVFHRNSQKHHLEAYHFSIEGTGVALLDMRHLNGTIPLRPWDVMGMYDVQAILECLQDAKPPTPQWSLLEHPPYYRDFLASPIAHMR